jgi:hypothetical protein
MRVLVLDGLAGVAGQWRAFSIVWRAFSIGGLVMDTAQHCLDQSAECRGLVQLAQSEAEAYALRLLARNWSGLAGQIDRYNALMREQRRGVRSADGPREQGSPKWITCPAGLMGGGPSGI